MSIVCVYVQDIGLAYERARLPHLQGEPFVLVDPDGLIRSVSDEALRYGISRGQSANTARSLFEDVIALPYDRGSYEIAARPIWDLIASESDVVEPESPETCFAVVAGKEIVERVRRLAEIIAPILEVPVRIGVGRTKLLAREASANTGEEAILSIRAEDEVALLAGLPLSKVAKLPLKERQSLERLGVRHLGDLLSLPPHRLPRWLRRVGNQLYQMLHGHDADAVRPVWPPRTLSAAQRFDDEVEDRFLIERTLQRLSERIARGLIQSHDFCREIGLTIGIADGSYLAESERLALPQSQPVAIRSAALRLLDRFHIELPILSLKLTAHELGSGSGVQMALMDEQGGELPQERRKRLEASITHLQKRFGARAIISAALLARARKINLWTFPLGHLLSERLPQVATDANGLPVRYWRHTHRRGIDHDPDVENPHYDILKIHNRWRSTAMRGQKAADTDVWRVETSPFGISELHHLETEWRLVGAWD